MSVCLRCPELRLLRARHGSGRGLVNRQVISDTLLIFDRLDLSRRFGKTCATAPGRFRLPYGGEPAALPAQVPRGGNYCFSVVRMSSTTPAFSFLRDWPVALVMPMSCCAASALMAAWMATAIW